MIIKLKFAVIALLMICSQNVFSQSKTVQGVVTDVAGLPLPGVSVLEQGTKNSASTGFDGKFTLNNVASGSKLVFTFIGMNAKTVVFTGQASVNVMLAAATEELKAVVVVAYGSQKRATVTGAISTVSAKDIAAIPVTNAAQALQGRAAGVTVTNGGGPGELPVVNIRGLSTFGNTQPVYVVDGAIVGNLSGVNPSDIDNISVLKDASTASLYGAIGANGVIIVTTKKGTKGKGILNFNAYTGVSFVTKRYDLLNTSQYLNYIKEISAQPYGVPNGNTRGDILKGNDVDYQDQIFQTGLMKDYNLSYSSGSESGSQRFSGEYQKVEGSLIGTDNERYNFRSNSSHTFGKLNVGASLGLSFVKTRPENSYALRTALENSIKYPPYLLPYSSVNTGGFSDTNGVKGDGQDADNPVFQQIYGEVANKTLGITGNIFAEYEFIPGLKFRSQVSLDSYDVKTKSFTPSYNNQKDTDASHQQPYSFTNAGFYFGKTILIDNSLSYKKTFAQKHNLELLALTSNANNSNARLSAGSRNYDSRFVSNVIVNNAAVNGSQTQIDNTTPDENKSVGLLGRLLYNYDEKYLLSGSVRRDASSKFGPDFRWGTFYSASLGWNIAKENFMKNTPINNLKLRGSYGTVGLNNIGLYQFTKTYSPSETGGIRGLNEGAFVNYDLRWEQKLIKNVGLDFGVYNNQFTGSVEVFNNLSTDLLVGLPVANSLGGGNIQGNYGSVVVKGVEVNLGYNDNKGDFTWSANFNIGTAKNEVVDLPSTVKFIDRGDFGTKSPGGQINRTQIGQSINSFYGLIEQGIYQSREEVSNHLYTIGPDGKIQTDVKPGDIRYKDVNGDGQITDADKEFIGNPFPDFTYGLNLSAAYKGFDLNLFFNGVQGNKIFNSQTFDLQGQKQFFNASTAVLDRAIPKTDATTGYTNVVNSSATIPRALGSDSNLKISNRYIEDGSFARLKNITIGYTLPNKAFDKYLTKLRIYASAQNLITLTKYSGLDPEIGGKNANRDINEGRSPEIGIDRGVYPQPKTIIMGVELTF
jgi:TonB-dependent starch-binding outer membrane protein SusC